MKKNFLGLLSAFAILTLSVSLRAQEPILRDSVPDTYTVVRGDTLWDISATFLQNPWMWPEIWHVNTQIANPHLIYPGDVIRLIYLDGKPRLTVTSRGPMEKLSPEVRIISAAEAIDTIPLDKINSFLSRSRIVTEEELEAAPYVVAGYKENLIMGAGDKLYARGLFEAGSTVYGVYRKGTEYVDPITREELGIQAMDIGSGTLRTVDGEVGTIDISRTTEEIRIGDRMLRQEERSIDSTFFPSPPLGDIDGLILAVEGGINQVGKMDVVVINQGEREGIVPGNVMAVYKRGGLVRDRVGGGRVQLPDQRAGLLMVFRAFEKISFGLVLEADQGIKVNDKVRNP